MARRFGKRASKIEGQFTWRTIEMLRSPAWCSLSLSAHRVLDRLEIELADHGGKDNGALPCTYGDFERYGIARHSVAPAIREVEALGFVEITQRGAGGNREFRKPSLYRLTYKPTDFAGPTDEWRRLPTEADVLAARSGRTIRKQNFAPRKSPVSPPENGGEKQEPPPPENGGTVPPPENGGSFYISGEVPIGSLAGGVVSALTASRSRARPQGAEASERRPRPHQRAGAA